MATKDDRPGLLSKVAMFVRNPTRDWSELEQPTEGDAAGYDKQALKAMIERKRQNDFVRKREFDQLRKLRNRDPSTLASMARPSFFQTSLATDLDGRAVTLKKIDEIEAQMSRQWWKARAQDSEVGTPSAQEPTQAPVEPLKDDSRPYQGPAGLSLPFASTEPMSRRMGDADPDFAPTVMATGTPSLPPSTEPEDAKLESSPGFSASALFAIDEMATDPELEEAAIRFANSDDAGAEAGLLAALHGTDLVPQAAQSWAAALLDFYRATGNRQGFENAANEFALHLDGIWPVWGTAEDAPPVAVAAPRAQGAAPVWNAPATLTEQAMGELRSTMMSKPMPWLLGWGELQTIAPDAWPLLDALFDSLCTESVYVRFEGHEQLVRVLRNQTPSGNRQVERSWWQARLNALRAMDLQDEFELAALDYCITHEVAPPEWKAPACRIEAHGTNLKTDAHAFDFGSPTAPMMADPGATPAARALQGELLGDATAALALLDAVPVRGNRLFIDCSALVRVDFAAAGGLLNWVSTRQAEGHQVQFQNVNRLVAAFFNVIGINEYAKVMPRAV